MVGRARLGQRQAGQRVAFRVLPHQQLTNESRYEGLVHPRLGSECGLQGLICDNLHPLLAGLLRARSEPVASCFGRLQQRTEQREGSDSPGLTGGQVLADQCTEGMPNQMESIGAELLRNRNNGIG